MNIITKYPIIQNGKTVLNNVYEGGFSNAGGSPKPHKGGGGHRSGRVNLVTPTIVTDPLVVAGAPAVLVADAGSTPNPDGNKKLYVIGAIAVGAALLWYLHKKGKI